MKNKHRSFAWDRPKRRKLIVTGIAAVLLGILYSMIFSFSAQDSVESGSLSRMISEKCVSLANALSGFSWSEAKMAGMAENFEHPLRKIAHFSEYACMGILVYVLWSQWMKHGRWLYLLTAVWGFLSAAGDEFHQYFVPGRYASIADVLLDTCGGAAGMLFCICAAALWRRHGEKKSRRCRGSDSHGIQKTAEKAPLR